MHHSTTIILAMVKKKIQNVKKEIFIHFAAFDPGLGPFQPSIAQ
jgi:hypothetical protein